MNPNDQAFVELCLALRQLGATTVECGDRRATFTATIPKHLTEPRVTSVYDDLERFPKK